VDDDSWLNIPAARGGRMTRARRRAEPEFTDNSSVFSGDSLGPTTQPQQVLRLPDEKPQFIEPERLDDLFRPPAR
jgi:hypothetical protein